MSQRNESAGIAAGFLLLLVIHALAFYLLLLLIGLLTRINSSFPTSVGTYLTTQYRFLFILGSPGLTQLIYVIPLVFLLRWQQRWGLMKGVIISAVLTALLNGGCWLLVLLPK